MTHINVRYPIYPGPAAEPVGPIFLRPRTTDALVYHQVWNEQLYRPVIGLRDYKLIIDAGANIGMSALYFSQCCPNAVILVVEPDLGNFDVAKVNLQPVSYRRGAPSIYWFRGGVAGFKGRASIADVGLGEFGFRTVPDPNGAVEVRTMPDLLDSVFLMPSNARPCLVKMDIEGAEIECLKDPRWLQDIDVLAIELHGPEAEMALSHALHNLVPFRNHRRWTVGETTFVEFI